jgi:hypothetical protein
MDKIMAMKILEISESQLTPEIIKKAYKKQALKYHPDKNNTEDANERFREIHDAYIFLNGQDDHCDYITLLKDFLKTWLDENKLYEWLIKIIMMCEEKSLLLLENINKDVLRQIYDLIVRHQDILHITNNFMEKMREIIKIRFEKDERIILHPFLDDLLENKLYKLVIHETTFLVPLWHHHLVYDAGNNTEIYVDCVPLLPEYVSIDEYNNIHIKLQFELHDIWKKDGITVYLGTKPIYIKKNSLIISDYQIKIMYNEGIAKITSNYEMIIKSDVYLHIYIQST